MASEVAQEAAPVLGVSLVAGRCFYELHTVCSLVVVVEAQFPRNHGVAGDKPFYADFVHHKFNPAVEHSVVVLPRSVETFDACHHTVVVVLGLSVPRLVHDARCDRLLSDVGKHLHNRAHGVEVRLAPQRHLIVACHGIRVLPEVEVQVPVARTGQCAVQYLHAELQHMVVHSAATHGERAGVCAGLGVLGHPYVQPQRLRRLALHGQPLVDVERVGNHGRVPFGFVLAASASALAVLVKLVGHHVAHEVGAHL